MKTSIQTMIQNYSFNDFVLDIPLTEAGLVMRREGNKGELAHVQTNVPHFVTHHSPTGYEFGYRGSGPADLALNTVEYLLHLKGHKGRRIRCFNSRCFQKAFDLHQKFKNDFIACAPREGNTVPYAMLEKWIGDHMKEE